MRKLCVLAGVALTALLVLSAPAAAGSGTVCDNDATPETTLTGVAIPGDLIVPEDESCTIINSTVGDDVKVGKNAYFEARNSDIADDVSASRSAGLFITDGSSVGGDVTTWKTFTMDVFDSSVGEDIEVSRSAAIHICGNEVGDDIEVSDSGPDIQVGDPANGCGANTVGDDIDVSWNDVDALDGILIVRGNTVADDLEVNHNRGTSPFKFVENNQGGDELECWRNEEPFNSSGNTGWNETEGQCEIPPTECDTAPSDAPIVVNAEGDLIVPENGICILGAGSTVGGNVFVGRGAYFQATGTRIGGDVKARGAAGVFLDGSTTVGGDVRISSTFTVDVFNSSVGDDIEVSRSVEINICGNQVVDDIEVEDSGPHVLVGDPLAVGCPGNTVGDDIEVEDNNISSILAVSGNTVADDLEVNHNRGAGEKAVQNNTGGDRLECHGNELPFVGSPNPGFTRVQGDQCAVI